jgi:hypothetical protein
MDSGNRPGKLHRYIIRCHALHRVFQHERERVLQVRCFKVEGDRPARKRKPQHKSAEEAPSFIFR